MHGMQCEALRHTWQAGVEYAFVESYMRTSDGDNVIMSSPGNPASPATSYTTWTNPFGDSALGLNGWVSEFPQLTVSGVWHYVDGSGISQTTTADDFNPYDFYQPYHASSVTGSGAANNDPSSYSMDTFARYSEDFGPDSYVCDCAAGYSGHDCEVNIDDCASSPCQHGSTCTDLEIGHEYYAAGTMVIDGETTTLSDGSAYSSNIEYLDVFYSIDGDLVGSWSDYRQIIEPPRPYIAPGTAADTYHCECITGFAGHDCEHNLDECESSPCMNGATCTDVLSLQNGTACDATDIECEDDEFWCGADCEDDEYFSDWHCSCVAGYIGESCETNVDECASNPCDNFATCQDLVNDYICHCPDAWEGQDCDISVDDCADSPCAAGTCVDHHGFFSCECPDDLEGPLCDEEKPTNAHRFLA